MSDFNKETIKLVAGLGNPGTEYESTYHNVGTEFIKYVLRQNEGNSLSQVQGKHFKYKNFAGFILVEPISYMNESGRAIKEVLEYFKILPQELLLVHDDVDIEMGEFKISKGQGSAGHRGIASVISELKTTKFNRLRIGIKKESSLRAALGMSTKIKAGKYVLHKISKHDQTLIDKAFKEAYKELF